MYPAPLVVLKSNPYKLAAVILAPICFTMSYLIPSSPPWKGTVNLSWLAVGPLAPVESIEALNEFTHKLELA